MGWLRVNRKALNLDLIFLLEFVPADDGGKPRIDVYPVGVTAIQPFPIDDEQDVAVLLKWMGKIGDAATEPPPPIRESGKPHVRSRKPGASGAAGT